MSKDDDGFEDIPLGEMETIDLNEPPSREEVQRQEAARAQEQKRAQDAARGVYGEDAQAPEGQEYQAPQVSALQKFKNNMQDRMEDLVDNLSMLKDDVRNKINDMVQTVTRPLKSFGKAVGEKISAVVNYRKNKRDKEISSAAVRATASAFEDTKRESDQMKQQEQALAKAQAVGQSTTRDRGAGVGNAMRTAAKGRTATGPAPRAAGHGQSTGRGGRG